MVDAPGLPPPLRAFVAERLIESLDIPDADPLSVRWREEIRRRCTELDRGAVELRVAAGSTGQRVRGTRLGAS